MPTKKSAQAPKPGTEIDASGSPPSDPTEQVPGGRWRDYMRVLRTSFPSPWSETGKDQVFENTFMHAVSLLDSMKHTRSYEAQQVWQGYLGSPQLPDYSDCTDARLHEEMMPLQEVIGRLVDFFDGMPNWNHPQTMANVIPPANTASIIGATLGSVFSPNIVEGEYSTNYQEHAYIEPQGATVVPNADGSVTVYATCQCPFYVQTGVAQGLGLPLAKVRVIQTVTGGGFGGKEDYPSLLSGYAGFAALATGRPVKLIYTREEDLQCSSKRHPSVSKFRTGVMKDGTIVAQEVEYILDAGAYVTLTGVVLFRGNAHAIGAYDVANVKVDSYGVLTNRVPCGAYRGFGSPQIIFAGETHMDAIADKLGMDPLELRRKNALGIGKRTMTDHLIEESCGFAECIDEATLSSEWGAKRAEYDAQPLDVRKRRGIGCATIYYGVGLGATGKVLDKSGALVQVHADGSVLVAVGTTDMGQGHKTVMAQFAAEELGIDVGRITVIEVDTALVPDSGPTVASRSTLMSGRAVMDGCRQIRERMAELACKKLGCDEVEFAEGQVTPKGGGEGMAFNALALQCWLELVHLAASGFFRTPATSWDEETGLGELYVTYSWATDIAEVEVDMETGEVTVLSIVAAHDVGRAVNPMAVEGQIEGGAVQGMGYAMMEDLVSENGVILNPGLNDYLVPTTKDAPVITPIIVEHPYPRGPHGAKGIGEPSLMAAPGAVTNAISHAIGARVNDLPVTQERIVRAIKGR